MRTPIRAPRANAITERFLGSVRRECLDHMLILTECHLRSTLKAYAASFNQARPHQSLGRRRPQPLAAVVARGCRGEVVAIPVLGGPHHDYQRAA